MARPQNLTTGIVQELGIAIVTGKYSPENPIPVEAALCEQFEASRSVLREAVKMLTAKGLLTARPRQGTRVEPEENWNLLDPDVLRWLLERKFSLKLLAEFAEIRLPIEPAAAWLAAQRGSAEEIKVIEDAIRRMEAAEVGDDDPLLSDIAFHVSILRASGNRFYIQFEDLIQTALTFSIRFTNRSKGVPVANVADHKKVLDAIKDGDADSAQVAMKHLIDETLSLINDAMEQQGK